jgi:hypothetical protein
MNEGFNISKGIHLDQARASAFYETNIPFNIIQHLAFVDAMKEIAKHWMPTYTPPTYIALCPNLLKAKKKMLTRKQMLN